jgi:hypothetical protein
MSSLKSQNIIQIANFLPKEERDKVFDIVCANKKAFQDVRVPESNQGELMYLPLELENSDRSEAVKIRQAIECLSKRIIKLLPKLFISLGVEPFPVSHVPFSVINGLNHHVGIPHVDESGGKFKISILYYFHKTPKTFQGGALEFYDTDTSFQSGHSDKPFAKIDHEDNLLIAFPCKTYHGVTNVQLDSNEFEDGRFVVVGFLGPQ